LNGRREGNEETQIRLASIVALAALSGFPALVAAAGSGAKEIFLNPAGDEVVVSPGETKPVPPRPRGKKVHAHQRRTPAQPSSAYPRNLGLSYWIELKEGADAPGRKAPGKEVTAERVFRSGERIRLHFRSNADGYIALLQMAASGSSSILFPDHEKGADDNRLVAGLDRVLPTEKTWFLFDRTPGTERLIVLFAKSTAELDSFPLRRSMDPETTSAVLRTGDSARGRKDLILETETQNASEIATYAVNLSGKPIIFEIQLHHR
jgi:hypothetical protein